MAKHRKYNKEKMRNAVENSRSLRGVMLKLGISPQGGNYRTVKQKIIDFGIDMSHFTGRGWNKGGYVIQPHSRHTFLRYVLIKNGKGWKSSNIKRKLFEFGFKERLCEECGCGEEWNMKRLSLQLDHINGDNSDNRLENLRILCPNCHSQTETFCYNKIINNISPPEPSAEQQGILF